MDSILREVFHFDMEDMKTNVDIVLTIDATKTMWSVWEMLESEALSFYDKLIKMVEADGMKSIGQLRVKVIWFRDFYYSGDYAYGESDFFKLPDDNENFRKYIANMRLCASGPEEESSLEALAMAMRSDFEQGGTFRRHIIVLFTDAASHPLEDYGRLCIEASKRGCKPTIYPVGMPKSLDELISIWNDDKYSAEQDLDGACDKLSRLDKTGRRLILYTPDEYPWTDIEMEMDHTIRMVVENGYGGREWFDKAKDIEDFYALIKYSID